MLTVVKSYNNTKNGYFLNLFNCMESAMKNSQIIFTKFSPLLAVDVDVVNATGSKIKVPRVCSLCRCGASKNKPFCEGSHSSIGFIGERENSDKSELEFYEGKNITIIYDRYLCMGAGHCGKLESVFRGKYKPDAAPVEKVIETIKKCPSGALSYALKDIKHNNYYELTQVVIEKDGPYHCQGGVSMIDDQDSSELVPSGDHYTLCRCGASKKKPFCDGAHKRIGFKDE